jgi:hypothetical protein
MALNYAAVLKASSVCTLVTHKVLLSPGKGVLKWQLGHKEINLLFIQRRAANIINKQE